MKNKKIFFALALALLFAPAFASASTLASSTPDVLSEYYGMSQYIDGEIAPPHCYPAGNSGLNSCQFTSGLLYIPKVTTPVSSVQFVYNQVNADAPNAVAVMCLAGQCGTNQHVAISSPITIPAYPYQVQSGKNITFNFPNPVPLEIGSRYSIYVTWHDWTDEFLWLFAPYNANQESIPLHVLRGTVVVPPEISFTNPTETEDDGIVDGKGVADKTKFIFSTTIATADTVKLFVDTSELPLEKIGDTYTVTSTFPKGVHTWHFEATKGSYATSTTEKTFMTGYSNVAFLPGLEASRLYDANGKKIWEPDWLWHDNSQLYMNADGTSAQSGIYAGDIIDNAYVPSKGNIYLSFISKMNDMKNDGTIKDWTYFAYDWRYSVESTVNDLMIQKLRMLADSSDTGKVTLIGHSNGGLVAKELSIKLGDDAPKLLDQMIFVAVPEAGTPSAVGAILHGYQQGLPFDWAPMYISPTEARTLAKNMPSAYGLLPSVNYFDYNHDPIVTFEDKPLLALWRAKYGSEINTGVSLQNFMTDQTRAPMPVTDALNNPNIGNEMLFGKAVTLHSALDNWTPPGNVQLTEIAGWGELTLKTIEYKQGVESSCVTDGAIRACNTKQVLYFDPKMTIDGDGTVVTSSALWTAKATGVNKYWTDLSKYNDLLKTGNIPRHHSDILEVPSVLDFTKNIITRNTLPLPQYISNSVPQYTGNVSRLAFTLHSPLSLDLTDDLGNHTGIAPDGTIEENIPGSRYMTFGEVKYISVPDSTNLHLSMKGYAEGSFTLKMEEAEGDTTISQTTFAGIPSTSQTTATMDISANGGIENASPLLVDINGDGKTDMSFAPKNGETILPDLTAPTTATTTTGTLGKNDWYVSDVAVKFTAIDAESGVKDTFYSLDKGITWAITTPLVISNEGTTEIQFYSIDNEGNKEAINTMEIKIDKTAPKATISVDLTAKDLKITGEDISGIASITNAKNTYTITDNAGHTTKLFFEKIFENKRLVRTTLVDVQYDNAKKKSLPDSTVSYKWENSKNTQFLSDQKIDVEKSFSVDADYDLKKNITTIIIDDQKKREDEKERGKEEHEKENEKHKKQTQKFTGLRVIQLTVDKGIVGYVI